MSKPSIEDICQMFAQQRSGVRRPPPYRAVRLVFRTDTGLHSFDIHELGRVGILKELGRFHVVPLKGPTEVDYYDELIEAGFVDELDSRGETRAAS